MQRRFSVLECAAKKMVTLRAALVSALAPHYPKSDQRGRPHIGLERMFRMFVARQCVGLSDEGIEHAIYDSQAIRRFI